MQILKSSPLFVRVRRSGSIDALIANSLWTDDEFTIYCSEGLKNVLFLAEGSSKGCVKEMVIDTPYGSIPDGAVQVRMELYLGEQTAKCQLIVREHSEF